jgi:GT2 family glycosyltransferase/glycosyltransferase involved in cell wall biosynthesis
MAMTGVAEVVAPELREVLGPNRSAPGPKARLVERQDRIGATDEASIELSGQVAMLREQLASLVRENSALQDALERERLTVIRPMLRRSFLVAKRLGRALPHPARVLLRAAFYEFVLRAAPRSNLAQQYEDFKRATNYVRPPMKAADIRSEAASLGDPLIQTARGYGGSGIDVFIFPIIDWHFRVQRPQHIGSRLARRGHRIFYGSTTFLPTSGPAFRLLGMPEEGVFLYQLSCPSPHPVVYSTPLNGKQEAWLAEAIRNLQGMVGARPAVALLHLPFWRSLAVNISSAALIYDCMDYHAGCSNTSQDLSDEEQKLINQADFVVTTSLALSNHVEGAVAKVLIRNGAEVEFFSAPGKTVPRSPRPTVGYFGAIAEWFDSELVVAAAESFLNWDFVLIGSTAHANVSKLRRLSNVKLPGERPYSELPGWLRSFDICIIPFKLNDLILHTNPVKLYEYLSAGKPVVATPLPELLLLKNDLVHIAGTKELFLEKLPIAMSECGDLEKVNLRRRWAAEQTWDDRANKFCQVIHSCLPKVSVVILCHNNLEFTKSCLSSLDQFTLYPNWELILVDNSSQDDTADYLDGYVRTRPWAHVIVSNEDREFAGGNNLGVKKASGEYLVLLNNDTFVTRGWLAALIRHLRRDPSLGLVGPVTNNMGNEARIDIVYQSMDEMANKARSYTEVRRGKLAYVDNLGFFCVAFPRKVYEQVGLLDEALRIGFFEDDDYCKRTRLAGYKIGIAEDVFVHHHLSASFSGSGA